MTVRVDSAEVVVGDVIHFMGTPHRVDRIDPYTVPTDPPIPTAGIARSVGADGRVWGITLISGTMLDVSRGVES